VLIPNATVPEQQREQRRHLLLDHEHFQDADNPVEGLTNRQRSR
jgi:hypothetical protein